MDLRYEAFCLADPLFFDEQRRSDSAGDDFTNLVRLPENGWTEGNRGTWRLLCPTGAVLPGQGWKIHVSATLDNAERVLARTRDYLVEKGIAFKHLRNKVTLLSRNSKYAPRDASGKLITIYPADDVEFERTLEELSAVLGDESGPYILSDLRYGNGPLYVRYGGFAERWVETDGTRVLAIERPDGTLVADPRGPVFTVPSWIAPPECLGPHLAARKGAGKDEFPYQVTGSLHFSNGGGVYRATRLADGKELVLKEARPHAGLDRDHQDAVTRLRREYQILTRLAGVPGIPEVYDFFPVWEHYFLAMEYLPGRPLGSWLARNYPLTRGDDSGDVAEYTERTLRVLDRVAEAIDGVHRRGIVFGDLHALNILVDEDDESVSLIDFELAAPVSDDGRPALGAPGFRAPPDRGGFEVDQYALAALRLWLFLPLVPILELSPGKLSGLVGFIERRFPLPDGFGESIRRVLTPRTPNPLPPAETALDQREPDWELVRKSIGEAILASATPDRTDRLFPGDIEQFRVGGACFGYGAAGVLHALDLAGLGRYPEHERWLLDAVRRDRPARPGFFDGAHGVAYVLHNLGHRDAAAELRDDARTLVEQTHDHGLASGLAGIALNLRHVGDHDKAVELGERMASALAEAEPPGDFARAGLLSGWSGPALLFVRLFEDTGDRAWLRHADRALERDLAECVPADDGSLQVRDGGARTLPYLAIGSAGIAVVAAELARHDPEAASVRRLPDLLAACMGEFTIHPGLLFGRCGLLAALAAADRNVPGQAHGDTVARHLSRLAWHAIPYGPDGIAFPGNQLLRLSMDVVTGGAGVLLTLAGTLDGHGAVLPFLGSTGSPGPST